MADHDGRDSGPLTRQELHEALRFVHAMAMQSKDEVERIDVVLAAVVRALLESGRLDRQRVDALLPEIMKQLEERTRHEVTVDIGPTIDKYTVASPPDLDCAVLRPICQARCCRLSFALSFQDLDEGGLQWDYARPYRIRQGHEGYCVHSASDTRGCTVYERRPATCRTYDCRNDRRIWADFEERILAPEPSPLLHPIRRASSQAPSGDAASANVENRSRPGGNDVRGDCASEAEAARPDLPDR
jgi:Fe-S-cluster containining protein